MSILASWTWPAKSGAAYRVKVGSKEPEPLTGRAAVLLRWYNDRNGAVPAKSAYLSPAEGGWSGVLLAPEGATSLTVNLHHWRQLGGRLRRRQFRAQIEEISHPASRGITVAVAHQRYPERSTWERNIELMRRLIARAGRAKVDLLCLTETFPDRGLRESMIPCGLDSPRLQPIFLAVQKARVHLVFTFYEKARRRIYNTAVLVSPSGKILGVYRKTHLTLTELDNGLSPGEDLPVFDTELGKIGIQTCWDAWFAEGARALARGGAEIICFPLAGDQYRRHWRHVWPARAMDNQVFLLASVTANCVIDQPSVIIAPDGRTLAQTRLPNTLATATITLPFATEVAWLLGAPSPSEFRNVIENSLPPFRAMNAASRKRADFT